MTGILNLYTNLSKQSLKSEYEEITPYPDSGNESEEDAPPLPMVHQPKAQAYRDTIAPLLEYQFSGSSLMVPGAMTSCPSPVSLASTPTLMHPDASPSVPSLRLTPDGTPGSTSSHAAKSDTSIQMTPEMSPIPVLPSGRSATSDSNEKKIVLEVPDVRDADFWYDQPLSPVSPEELEYRNTVRDSQQSAVSPHSPATQTNHFRSMAFESLSPPAVNVKTGPGPRLVKVIDGDKAMIPLPLDLNRSRTLISRCSTPAHQTEIVKEVQNEKGGAKSQRSSLIFAGDVEGDLIDGPLMKEFSRLLEQRMSYLTEESESRQHLRIDEIYRPGSAFSDSSDSYVIHDTISGQVKAMWRDKFGKKKDKKRKSKEGEQADGKSMRKSKGDEKKEKTKSGPTMTKNVITAFSDEPDSYRYPYKLTQDYTSEDSERYGTEPGQVRQGNSITYGERPSVGDTPRPLVPRHENPADTAKPTTDSSVEQLVLEHPANPLTRYQKYGVEIWYESNKKKRRQEREKLRKEAEKLEKQAREARASAAAVSHVYTTTAAPYTQLPSHLPDPSRPGFYQQINHSHKASTGSTGSPKPSAVMEGDSTIRDSQQRRNGGKSVSMSSYNNDLFEASGGDKKKSSGFASRLMMSSEEKRKRKVKESITIVGGERMEGGSGAYKGLMKI